MVDVDHSDGSLMFLCSSNGLEGEVGSMAGSSQKHQSARKRTVRTGQPALRVSSAVTDVVHDPCENPAGAGASSHHGMGPTTHQQKEEELRQVLQGVLVCALHTVEHLAVLAVHLGVRDTKLVSRLTNLDTLPECHQVGGDAGEEHVAEFSWHS